LEIGGKALIADYADYADYADKTFCELFFISEIVLAQQARNLRNQRFIFII